MKLRVWFRLDPSNGKLKTDTEVCSACSLVLVTLFLLIHLLPTDYRVICNMWNIAPVCNYINTESMLALSCYHGFAIDLFLILSYAWESIYKYQIYFIHQIHVLDNWRLISHGLLTNLVNAYGSYQTQYREHASSVPITGMSISFEPITEHRIVWIAYYFHFVIPDVLGRDSVVHWLNWKLANFLGGGGGLLSIVEF